MSRLYDGHPRTVSELTLSDGRSAVYISRERKHFSNLHDGYPLAEEFLEELKKEEIDAIVIDGSDGTYVFDRRQYHRGDRLGHDPYPMKRVVSVDAAESSPNDGPEDDTGRISEWEWVTDRDLRSTSDRSPRPCSGSD